MFLFPFSLWDSASRVLPSSYPTREVPTTHWAAGSAAAARHGSQELGLWSSLPEQVPLLQPYTDTRYREKPLIFSKQRFVITRKHLSLSRVHEVFVKCLRLSKPMWFYDLLLFCCEMLEIFYIFKLNLEDNTQYADLKLRIAQLLGKNSTLKNFYVSLSAVWNSCKMLFGPSVMKHVLN